MSTHGITVRGRRYRVTWLATGEWFVHARLRRRWRELDPMGPAARRVLTAAACRD